MILDTFDHSLIYEKLHPLFPLAFSYLRTSPLTSLPQGRHEIDGDSLYAVVADAQGTSRDTVMLESHVRYIDIHLPLEGTDMIGYKPTVSCKGKGYDSEHDVELYHDRPETWCTVPPGSFAVFFPEDAHAPMVSTSRLHKIVVKVRV